MKIELNLTPRMAERLWVNSTRNFVAEQSDRFIPVEPHGTPLYKAFENGTLYWCEAAADMILLNAYEGADGYVTCPLMDEACVTGDVSGYVVLSSRPWKWDR